MPLSPHVSPTFTNYSSPVLFLRLLIFFLGGLEASCARDDGDDGDDGETGDEVRVRAGPTSSTPSNEPSIEINPAASCMLESVTTTNQGGGGKCVSRLGLENMTNEISKFSCQIAQTRPEFGIAFLNQFQAGARWWCTCKVVVPASRATIFLLSQTSKVISSYLFMIFSFFAQGSNHTDELAQSRHRRRGIAMRTALCVVLRESAS